MIPIRDNIACKTIPYTSWAIMTVCIGIFMVLQFLPEENQRQIIYLYGMVPTRYSSPQLMFSTALPANHYLPFLTNLFLHVSWLHIIINMWFMWIFAKNIEDRMGHGRFLVFYLFCGLSATYLQWLSDPSISIPLIGASGAVAGILGAYFFIYPYARVVIWLPLLFLPIFFELPAIAFLGFWVIIQFQKASSAVLFDEVSTNVAWWAHIGGFITGALSHFIFFKSNTGKEISKN